MFQSTTNSDRVCDNEGSTLGAGLLITTTTDGKYSRLWRRTTLCVGILIFIKKVPNNQHIVIDIPSESENEEKKEVEKIAQIVIEKDLKSLREFGGVDEVQKCLSSRSEAEAGIDGGQDDIWVASSADEKSFFYFFWKACSSFPIIILFVSAVLFFVLDFMQEGRKDGWHDGVAILVFVIWLVAYSSVGNFYRQRKMVKKLSENMNRLEVNVERSGQHRLVSISGVKVGDKVHLEKGDRVPADGLLVNGEDLELDEIFNSKIDRDRNPFLFSGSKVIEGSGRMLVTAVGANTTMGKSLSLVMSTHEPNEKSLLEDRIEKPNAYIEKLTLCVSVLVVLVLITRFICWKHSNNNDLTELKGSVPMDKLMKMFEEISLRSQGRIWILTSALTVMVIAIQHGMPFMITVSLFYWKVKVEEHEAKPQNLSACATMGLVTVICFDATGGLMCEAVEINNFYIGEKDINNNEHSETGQVVLQALWQGIIGASVLAPEIYARPTNDWLISWAKDRCGFNMEDLHQNYDILKSTKLSCVKKGAGVLMKKKDDGEQFLHWNGAASTILDMCSHYYDSNGESHAMEGQKRELFEQVIKDMEEKGLRTIAFAYRQTNDQDLKEDGLNLLALVGLKYSCQEEFKKLVKALKDDGVSIKLVSEDDLSAVKAIACGLEISRPGSNVVALKGIEIQEGMEKLVDRATVIGSLLPDDKLRIVKCLKLEGHIVAYFGGLTTSDTPALKEADVGITDQIQSTELARESSDIIVKSFGSLVPVLKFGRCDYHNIQKFTQLQLTACISGLLITLLTTMITGESPITGIQLIWVNLVMYLLGGLMMVMKLESQEPLTEQAAKPKRTESLITKDMWRNIAIQVLYQASILLIFQFKGQTIPSMNDDVRKTMIFNTFILCQIFNQFNVMNIFQIEVLRVVLQSYWFLVALVAVLVMQVMVIEFFGSIANYVRLNAVQWALCFLFAAFSWGFDWALKVLPLFLTSWSVGTHYESSNRMTRPHVNISSFSIPFFMFLFFSVSYIISTQASPGLFDSTNQFENAPRPA